MNTSDWKTDTERQEHVIEKVDGNQKDGWTIVFDGVLCAGVTAKHCKVPPKVGERVLTFGRGFGYSVRGIVIDGRVYRYETPEQHEASQKKVLERWEREREERDRAFRAKKKPPIKPFVLKNDNAKASWDRAVRANSDDAYSFRCVEYAAHWAFLMEQRLYAGEALTDIAEECSREADTDGITGFMYGAAVNMLSAVWYHGEELRRWHNLKTQAGNEGERANEEGGVLNPAVLTIG